MSLEIGVWVERCAKPSGAPFLECLSEGLGAQGSHCTYPMPRSLPSASCVLSTELCPHGVEGPHPTASQGRKRGAGR